MITHLRATGRHLPYGSHSPTCHPTPIRVPPFSLIYTVLRWFTSFVSGRTQQVSFDGHLSPVKLVMAFRRVCSWTPALCHVHCWSRESVAQHGLHLHQYADDCQVYLSATVNDAPTSVDRFARCIEAFEACLSASRLRLNPDKTQVLWLGSRYQVDRITLRHVPVLSSSVQVDSARNLGVVIDSHLTMADHVTAVCRAAYYQLRQLRLITTSLTVDAAKTLVQSSITCHLDCCNALFSGITDTLLRRLQSVQNAAARLVTGTRRRDHITPVLRQLHWLPVRQRVHFKTADPGLQGDARFNCRLQRILSTRFSSHTPATIGQHRHVLCATDQHMVRRPEFRSRWTTALEQSAGQDSPARQRHWRISFQWHCGA